MKSVLLSAPAAMLPAFLEYLGEDASSSPVTVWVTESLARALADTQGLPDEKPFRLRILPGNFFMPSTVPASAFDPSGHIFVARRSSGGIRFYANAIRTAFRLAPRVTLLDEAGRMVEIGRFSLLLDRFHGLFRLVSEAAAAAAIILLLPFAAVWSLLLRIIIPPSKRPGVAVLGGSRYFPDRDASLLEASAPVVRIPSEVVSFAAALPILLSLLAALPRIRASYSFFASANLAVMAFFRLFGGVRSIAAVGGYDANHIPEIGYNGIPGRRYQRIFAGIGLRFTDALLPDDPSLFHGASTRVAPRLTGLKAEYGLSPEKVEWLPLGFDPDLWLPGEKENLVVAAANIDSRNAAVLKGFDLLPQIARLLPDIAFRVIGVAHPACLADGRSFPPNLETIPFLPEEEMPGEFARARVVFLASLVEGMPSVLGEAMCAGCVPVGSNVGGIPTIIGDAGIIALNHDPGAYADAIRRAIKMDGDEARRRIIEVFPLSRRARALKEIVIEGRPPRPSTLGGGEI